MVFPLYILPIVDLAPIFYHALTMTLVIIVAFYKSASTILKIFSILMVATHVVMYLLLASWGLVRLKSLMDNKKQHLQEQVQDQICTIMERSSKGDFPWGCAHRTMVKTDDGTNTISRLDWDYPFPLLAISSTMISTSLYIWHSNLSFLSCFLPSSHCVVCTCVLKNLNIHTLLFSCDLALGNAWHGLQLTTLSIGYVHLLTFKV